MPIRPQWKLPSSELLTAILFRAFFFLFFSPFLIFFLLPYFFPHLLLAFHLCFSIPLPGLALKYPFARSLLSTGTTVLLSILYSMFSYLISQFCAFHLFPLPYFAHVFGLPSPHPALKWPFEGPLFPYSVSPSSPFSILFLFLCILICAFSFILYFPPSLACFLPHIFTSFFNLGPDLKWPFAG